MAELALTALIPTLIPALGTTLTTLTGITLGGLIHRTVGLGGIAGYFIGTTHHTGRRNLGSLTRIQGT